MNESEKYTILFGDLEPKAGQKQMVEGLWHSIACDVERKRNTLVGAVITESNIICGSKRDCAMRQHALFIQVVCIRNPVMCSNAQEYRNALTEIVWRVKEQLGNPYAAVIQEQVNFFYFTRR